MKARLFVDMDGTLAVFKKHITNIEALYEEGYFENLLPNKCVVEAIKIILRDYPEIEVFVNSSRLRDSKYALSEKNNWLDKYLPEIDEEHRLFPFCGQSKADCVPGGITENDYLLDDYKPGDFTNAGGVGIKLYNGVNGTQSEWVGPSVSYTDAPEVIAEKLVAIITQKKMIKSQNPLKTVIPPIDKLLSQYRTSLRGGDLPHMVHAGNLLYMKYGIVMPEPLNEREMKLLQAREDEKGTITAKYLINGKRSNMTIRLQEGVSGDEAVVSRLLPQMHKRMCDEVQNLMHYTKQKQQIRELQTIEDISMHEPDFTGLTEKQIRFINQFMDSKHKHLSDRRMEREQ